MFKMSKILVFAVVCLPLTGLSQDRVERSMIAMDGTVWSRWNITFFSIASVPNMSFGKQATGARAIDSYNYFGFNNKLDSDTKFSVRIPFVYSSSGQNQYADQVASNLDLQDVHFAYSKYDLGYIGDVDLSGNVKVYLPTSSFSQNSKMISKLRLELYMEYAFSRYSSVTYAVKPDIFWQRQTAYFNIETPQWDDGSFKRDPRATTKQYAFDHYLEAVFDLNKYFSVKPSFGFHEDWYYSSSIEQLEGSHVTRFVSGLGLEIRAKRGLTFTLGVQDQTTLGSYRGRDVAFWQPENTNYSLMTNAYVF